MNKEGDDLVLWGMINVWGMSDEETDEQGRKELRTVEWREEEYTDLVRRCDRALGLHRNYGPPSEREPNIHCLKFVKNDNE